MPSAKEIARRRAELFIEQKGLCYWCKVEMTPTLPTRGADDPPYPPTMCTLDHVYSRLDPRRFRRRRPGEARRVAACIECNQERSVADQKIYAIEAKERARRSRV